MHGMGMYSNQLGGAATFTTIKGSPGMMYFPILSEELIKNPRILKITK